MAETAVRPFHVSVPQAELTDLRSRINAAKWPERETPGSSRTGRRPYRPVAQVVAGRVYRAVGATRQPPKGRGSARPLRHLR
jgi:Epoxide hydrolase N terminus